MCLVIAGENLLALKRPRFIARPVTACMFISSACEFASEGLHYCDLHLLILASMAPVLGKSSERLFQRLLAFRGGLQNAVVQTGTVTSHTGNAEIVSTLAIAKATTILNIR